MGELPIGLCLAGHTHGGQVWVPGYGPLVTDSAVPREWARGFRELACILNVSAGAGSSRGGLPPMLELSDGLTLIELVPSGSIR